MANLLIVTEYSEGEFKLRGDQYFSFVIFDLDKLDVLSKKVIEKQNLVQKWADNDNCNFEDITPMNGIDWCWEDIEESIVCNHSKYNKAVENTFKFKTNIYRLDTSKTKDLKTIFKLLKGFEHDNLNKNEIESIFINYALCPYFSVKEIRELDITKNVSYKTRGIVDISISNDVFSTDI